jgi:hypothetical protein
MRSAKVSIIRRIRWTLVWYLGNLRQSNRRYWGWVSIRTAWHASGPLSFEEILRWLIGIHETPEPELPSFLLAGVRVTLSPGGGWRPALLTIREKQAVIFVRGVVRGPRNVECVRVFSDCPIELFDAAIERGYYIEGQPREAAK